MVEFVVCVVCAVVSGVCAVILVPNAYVCPLVRLRLLKCVAITAVNLSLAAFTISPHSQVRTVCVCVFRRRYLMSFL